MKTFWFIFILSLFVEISMSDPLQSIPLSNCEYEVKISTGANFGYQNHFCLNGERTLGLWWDQNKQIESIVQFSNGTIIKQFCSPQPARWVSPHVEYAILGEPGSQYTVWDISKKKATTLDLGETQIATWGTISDTKAVSTTIYSTGRIALLDLLTAKLHWIEVVDSHKAVTYLTSHGLVSPNKQHVLFGAEGWNGEKTIYCHFVLNTTTEQISAIQWDCPERMIPLAWSSQPGLFYAEESGLALIRQSDWTIIAKNTQLTRIISVSLDSEHNTLYAVTSLDGLYCLDPTTLAIKSHYPKIGRTINACSLGTIFCREYVLLTTPYSGELAIFDRKEQKLLANICIVPACAGFLLYSKNISEKPQCIILPTELPYE